MPESGTSPDDPHTEARSRSRGVAWRVFIYLIGVHFFAAFLFLLFELGANAGQ